MEKLQEETATDAESYLGSVNQLLSSVMFATKGSALTE